MLYEWHYNIWGLYMNMDDSFNGLVKNNDVTSNQFFKTYKETKKWLDEMRIKKYRINKDTLVVDIYLGGWLGSYGNILKLLYVKGVGIISSNSSVDTCATDILNAEIKRQPDPRKRNLLKVAQELSNAGFHHLTI